MKKILEVLQQGDIDIRFHTDFDPVKNPNVILDTISRTAFAMVTKLWGGNEQAVLAMLRALIIADLAVCVDRKKMIRFLDEQSAIMAKTFHSAMNDMKNRGIQFTTIATGTTPPGLKN